MSFLPCVNRLSLKRWSPVPMGETKSPTCEVGGQREIPMAVLRVACELRNGQQRPLMERLSWTAERGGFTGIPWRAPARLNPANQWWLHKQKQFVRCSSSFARNLACPSGCMAGEGSQSVCQPTLAVQTVAGGPLVEQLLQARPAGGDGGVTAESVRRLCDQGLLTEAIEALELLGQYHVHAYRCIPKSLLYTVLKKCMARRDLGLGRRVHAVTVKQGFQSDTFLGFHILRMYSSYGKLQEAMDVFEVIAEPDAFTWSAIISAHVKYGQDKQAIQLYHRMRRCGVRPDGHVFVAALRACSKGADLKSGQQVHADVLASGVQPDLFVCNCLVDMYAKCGSLEHARRVFDGLGEKDVVTWTAMLAGYSQQGMGQEALRLYGAMQEEGIIVPDAITFIFLLQACASVGPLALEEGKQLHLQIRQRGHEADVFVASSLVNMYAKCGSLEAARRVFDALGKKNVVMWTAMIAGYSQQDMGQEALRLYSAMQNECLAVPDYVTFVCLLQACGNVAALDLGKQLHAQITEQGLQADAAVAGSLINMYGKCGSMPDAQQVFDALPARNVMIWTALIAGYTSQGETEVVFDLVQRMIQDGIQPNGITFLHVLTVCSHGGLVKEGWAYFEAMGRDHGISPTEDHYVCMADLLGRAGHLDEALAFVRSMPILPNASVWHALLGASQKWSNIEVGCHAFNEAVKLAEDDASAYVLMSNIYTSAQMWEQAQQMQATRKRMRAWKQPGQSWWTDDDGWVHSFQVSEE